MADYAIPKSGVAYIFYTALVSQADTKLLKSAPTLSAGDFKVSIDGGAFANLATLPTNTPSGTAVKISLSAGEMTGDNILVTCIDAAGAEWCDQAINIQTSPVGLNNLATPTNITAGTITTTTNLTNLPAITAGWLTATGIADNAITAAKIADSAIDTATFATGATIPRCTLVDTTTTNTDMRGTDSAALATTAALIKANTDYPDDCVYLDPTNGASGTTVGTNGTIGNPSDTLANANTIATARGKKRIKFVPRAAMTLSSGGYTIDLDLNAGSMTLNQDAVFGGGSRIYSSAMIHGTVTPDVGAGQNTVDIDSNTTWDNIRLTSNVRAIGYCYLTRCVIGNVTSAVTFTILNDSVTDPVYLQNCYTAKASGITFDIAAGKDLILDGWYGDFTIANLSAGSTVQIYGYAKVTVASSCTGGTVRHDSHVEITNNSTGGATTTDLISEATPWNPAWDAEIQSECTDALTAYAPATAAAMLIVSDGVGFLTAVAMGACADPQTAAETYQITFGGSTYTVDYTGLDATGTRTATTRTKT